MIGVAVWGWALVHGVVGIVRLASNRSLWQSARGMVIVAVCFNAAGLIALATGLVTVLMVINGIGS